MIVRGGEESILTAFLFLSPILDSYEERKKKKKETEREKEREGEGDGEIEGENEPLPRSTDLRETDPDPESTKKTRSDLHLKVSNVFKICS